MATMQHKIFCVREFIKTESATAVQRAFRFRFNIQRPTRKTTEDMSIIMCFQCVKQRAVSFLLLLTINLRSIIIDILEE